MGQAHTRERQHYEFSTVDRPGNNWLIRLRILDSVAIGGMMKRSIVLTQEEQDIVKIMVARRQRHQAMTGAKSTFYNGKKSDLDSFGAEWAFCKLYSLYPDLDVVSYPYYDAILPDGRTVDVKNTDRTNGRLIVKTVRGKPLPDLYVLIIGKLPVYTYVGFATSFDLIREERMVYDIPHPAPAMSQEELFHIPFPLSIRTQSNLDDVEAVCPL